MARAIAACARTSSGLVGSSNHQMSDGASASDPAHRVRGPERLVGVDHEATRGTDHLPGEGAAAHVVGEVAADLQLDRVPARGDGLPTQAHELVVVVAQPAGARRVGRVALLVQPGLALRTPGELLLEHRERGLGGERVAQVAPVDEVDQLLRGHVREDLPHRLPDGLADEVPGGVDHRGEPELDRPLGRAEPAQLAVGLQVPGEAAGVGHQLGDRPAPRPPADRLRRRERELVAAPDREREAVALQVGVGVQDDVGGRVVRRLVHGVRPVERA